MAPAVVVAESFPGKSWCLSNCEGISAACNSLGHTGRGTDDDSVVTTATPSGIGRRICTGRVDASGGCNAGVVLGGDGCMPPAPGVGGGGSEQHEAVLALEPRWLA